MARSDPQLNFRIPEDLRERLEEAAKTAGRSLTSELVSRLQASFEPRAVGSDERSIPESLYGYVIEFAQNHQVSPEEALVRMLAGAANGVGGGEVVLIVPRPGMKFDEMRAVMDMAKLEWPDTSHIIYDSGLQSALPPASFEETKGGKSVAKKPSKTVKNAVLPMSGPLLDHYAKVIDARMASTAPLVPKPPANKGPARSPNARKPKS